MAYIQKDTTAEEIVQHYQTDLTGKVVIVTGANAGIGFETARVLALAGAKVILACRSPILAQAAIDQIVQSQPAADLHCIPLDLASLSSIDSFVTRFESLQLKLDILINNAGIMTSQTEPTQDGFEIHFGVNYLGPFWLTQRLVQTGTRVVFVSSAAQYHFSGEGGGPARAYGYSKLCILIYSQELQRRRPDLIVTSLHPGAVKTARTFDLGLILNCLWVAKDLWSLLREVLVPKSVELGASTTVFCAVSPEAVKGGYYVDNQIHTKLLNEKVNDMEFAKHLWEESEKMIAEKLT